MFKCAVIVFYKIHIPLIIDFHIILYTNIGRMFNGYKIIIGIYDPIGRSNKTLKLCQSYLAVKV